jgi:hypothetical protein
MGNVNLQPLLDAVDAHGYVLCFELQSKEWRRLAAVDAREQYEHGTIALSDPEESLPPAALTMLMHRAKFVRKGQPDAVG